MLLRFILVLCFIGFSLLTFFLRLRRVSIFFIITWLFVIIVITVIVPIFVIVIMRGRLWSTFIIVFIIIIVWLSIIIIIVCWYGFYPIFLANIMIATIKNKIGIINVTTNNTNGIVTIAANRNKKPESILIFIEIKAKNEINKQMMK